MHLFFFQPKVPLTDVADNLKDLESPDIDFIKFPGFSGKFLLRGENEEEIRSFFTEELIQFLEENEIDYSWCDIPSNGFHKNDGHPNSTGYETLKRCTEDALDKVV